jgi:hypothetical protein
LGFILKLEISGAAGKSAVRPADPITPDAAIRYAAGTV